MVPTSFPSRFLRRLVRTRSQRSAPFVHPDQVPDAQLILPRRIDDPATAAQVTRDLLRHHREVVTLALYLDDQHRLVGTAIVAAGWVQQARLSARPLVAGATACRATGCVLARYAGSRGTNATEQERRSFGALAPACSRYGLRLVDHVIVAANGSYGSVPQLHG